MVDYYLFSILLFGLLISRLYVKYSLGLILMWGYGGDIFFLEKVDFFVVKFVCVVEN